MTVSTNTNRPPLRAVYIGTFNQPARYNLGIAIETPGFDDPASHEHLAWAHGLSYLTTMKTPTIWKRASCHLSPKKLRSVNTSLRTCGPPSVKLGDYVGFER
jgi:hypothetical protein